MEGGDRGPFRASRSAYKSGARQPEPLPRQSEPTPRQSEAPQPAQEVPNEPNARSQKTTLPRANKPAKLSKWPFVVGFIAIILGAIGWFLWSASSSTVLPFDNSKYQAVTTTDGQVYFGKLNMLGGDYIKLSDAYYLRAQSDTENAQNTKNASVEQDKVKLVRLSNKIYSPKNTVVIPKSQVLSYESLDPSGQVAKWLKQNSGTQ